MNEVQQRTEFSVKKRQDTAHAAMLSNANLANESAKATQNWLLILGLAELSFLGSVLLKYGSANEDFLIFIKIFLVILLVGFIMFFLGSLHQRRHILRSARKYQKISDRAVGYINDGKKKLDEEPDELKLPEQQMVSSRASNQYFIIAIGAIFVVTIGIIFLIIFI